MDWSKILSDMALLTEKPMNEGVLVFAMYLDLYKETNNPKLKEAIELTIIKILGYE